MLLHAIGSASDSGGSASANSRRSTGARATRRMAPAPGRGGRTTQRLVRNLRHAAVCRLRNAPTDRPIEKRLRSVSSLLIVLSLTPTRISILAPGMGPGYIHSLSLRSSVVDVCPAGAVVVSARRSFGLPKEPETGNLRPFNDCHKHLSDPHLLGRMAPPPRSPLITCSPLPASIRRTMLPDSRRVS